MALDLVIRTTYGLRCGEIVQTNATRYNNKLLSILHFKQVGYEHSLKDYSSKQVQQIIDGISMNGTYTLSLPNPKCRTGLEGHTVLGIPHRIREICPWFLLKLFLQKRLDKSEKGLCVYSFLFGFTNEKGQTQPLTRHVAKTTLESFYQKLRAFYPGLPDKVQLNSARYGFTRGCYECYSQNKGSAGDADLLSCALRHKTKRWCTGRYLKRTVEDLSLMHTELQDFSFDKAIKVWNKFFDELPPLFTEPLIKAPESPTLSLQKKGNPNKGDDRS